MCRTLVVTYSCWTLAEARKHIEYERENQCRLRQSDSNKNATIHNCRVEYITREGECTDCKYARTQQQ